MKFHMFCFACHKNDHEKKINLKFIFVFFNQFVDAECIGHHVVGRDYQKSNNG